MLAAAPMLVLAGGVGVGTVAGFVVGAAQMAGADNDWAALGAFLWGLLVGIVVAVVVYVAALIVVARRLFAPGRRAAPVLLTLLAHSTSSASTADSLTSSRPAPG
ncbi:hypothetical protein [Actinoplanes sichuanensis]|uniref:Uncharacterized protein n=1 Tax=Actinoplanes sichuanensis TaxID=512349 RepID=A0ABW4A521_9ACTN|nr:hypothetical protein [Actinoplanes sichuanensis]